VPGVPYWTAVGIAAVAATAACLVTRRRGPHSASAVWIGRGICLLLAVDGAIFVLRPVFGADWTTRGSLPLDLCDVALVVAAVTCWHPGWQLGVELTYFWGLAGTLQAVLTPDLSSSYPHVEFFQFVVAHLGILLAVTYLVLGLGCAPRRGAVMRVFTITLAYTAAIAVVDVVTGGNYMYLRRRPAESSLLSVLGPWPWYILGAAGVALVLFWLLYLPFRLRAERARYGRPVRLG
jgi:hypothetical integral membrane protein (TIGR02206 family)